MGVGMTYKDKNRYGGTGKKQKGHVAKGSLS